jgi:hypothetical protein
MRIKFLFIFSLLLFFNNLAKSQQTKIFYKNIVILSDLSSRLNNRPPKDLIKISEILGDFRNNWVKPGQKIGDRSSILFSAFSNSQNISIDLDFDEIAKKQAFINSQGIFKNNGLDAKIQSFKAEVNDIYKNVRNPGLDLISMLNEKISNEIKLKNIKLLSKEPETIGVFYNHIYILTDGYLEFQTKNASPQFYFGIAQISSLRNYCINNNFDINTALNRNKSFCLPKVTNPKNKLIHLHVWETHERDKNLKSQTYKNPIGLRDNEILEAVWRKWALESGFKSFDWKKY